MSKNFNIKGPLFLKQDAKRVLKEQIINFWMNKKDKENGGFFSFIDYNLKMDPYSDKGVILNSRILYFFSECAMIFEDFELNKTAKHAYDFLINKCYDYKEGGVYWSVRYDGKPQDTTKHTYNQAFAIYALSSYYELTKEISALNCALRLFDLIETKCTDELGYLEAFDSQWNPIENDKLSENNVIAARTMNTLLHIFEAYSNLYRVSKNTKVKIALVRILDIYKKKIYNPNLKRQEVFLDKDYNSLLDLVSYGHDIESSWLIDWGCDCINDPALSYEINMITSELAKNVYKNAYINNSVCNEKEDGKVDTDRIWWVQSEAVVGFFNMWQKEPQNNISYYEACERIWVYIQENLVDKRENSEWYWAVDENGVPIERFNIVDSWKCPYHNGRMCLEIIKRCS